MPTRTADTASAAPRRRGRPPRVSADDIVRAAITLFARLGYRNTTIAAIAEAVGVTDGSVLHYFDNKLEILEAALAYDDEPANKEFLAYIEPGGLDALRGLAEWGARMEASPETTSMLLVLSAEALSAGSELHGRFQQRYTYIRRRLTKAIQKGIHAGEIRPDIDADHEATAFLSFIDGLRLQWFYADGKLSLDAHMRAFADHVIERIAVPTRGRRSQKTRVAP
jgi:AcrR family transcriptional regulator